MNQKSTILVLDDDLAMRPLWESILQTAHSSCELLWAVSSEQALQIVTRLQKEGALLSLIVADIFLAGSMTGIDFLNQKPIQSMKVAKIVTSSADQRSLEVLCRQEMPGVHVIKKPLDIKSACRLVKNILQNEEGES